MVQKTIETGAETDSDLPSGLYIIATPIGNIGDITLRALETLGKVDMIACEDTRTTGKLTTIYDLPTQKIPYHDHNATEMRPKLIALLKGGQRIALLSDAGMPLISDPGYKLVQQCVEEDIPVTCVPGATASLTALVLSGLPTDKFMFAGFLPPKAAARKTALVEIKAVPATLIFYETAPRLTNSLTDMLEVLGDRPAALARELTKKFEEVRRAPLSELAKHYQTQGEPKGEIVVVVAPPSIHQAEVWTEAALDNLLTRMISEEKMSVKDAAAFVAAKSGIKKRDVYQRALLLGRKKT
ncbi:MAG: 16S rRNA (cytidine(1402)-2'-O)-methyltransferase [Proteobacteria bacterium]|nr:16S rRNA (cytidine(1402)-2'-O)-methyltransferase [Pseudomonadota bacterium]